MIIRPADRLNELREYYFSSKLKEVASLRSEGKDIINMGIGSPDLMPDYIVISELIEQTIQARNHGYQAYQGIPELRKAIADFTQNKYQVDLSTEQILPLIGSKEGITHISLAYLNPGEEVLIPSLGYPTYTSVTKMVGAVPVYYPLIENQNWEPDWDFLEKHDYSRTKLLWLNYPHMPTGQKGSIELLKRFVDLAKRKGVLLCHDNPYSFIQNEKPLSIFNVTGAKEVALELNSLSKTFNMAGWRVGWLAGEESLLKPVITIKSNMDSGMFRPIQMAAAKALSLGQSWFNKLDAVYSERRQLVNEFLSILHCEVAPDQAGMFVWAKVSTIDCDQLCDSLLYEKGIFITPGRIFGDAGSNYIRISLCVDAQIIQKAIDRLK